MACNVNGNTGKPYKATVAAGSVFTAEFHHESRSSQGIDPSHKLVSLIYLMKSPSYIYYRGSVIAYLAKVSDATTSSASGLKWY
jgi:hypothetical protein